MATVHPPQANQKFWPLKKFALAKSIQIDSDRQKESSVATSETRTKDSSKHKTATNLVTLSKQQQDTNSSNSLQRRPEKKGTSLNNTSVSRNHDNHTKMKSGSATATVYLKSRQHSHSSQDDRINSVPFVKQNKTNRIHQQQQYSDDSLRSNIDTSSTTFASAPMSQPTPPIAPVNTNTLVPSTAPIILDMYSNDQVDLSIKSAPRPKQRLLRPTSCINLRQVAFHQTHHLPSPKSKHYSMIYDSTNSKDMYQQQHYHQNMIKRSNTFNHMTYLYSPYRRSSESTQDDTLLTSNSENDDDVDTEHYLNGDYYYYYDDDDDDQTVFSNSVLSTDSSKSPPPPLLPPNSPSRRMLKRSTPLICQRLPDSLCTMDPSTCCHRYHQISSHHPFDHLHGYEHHPSAAAVLGTGDLCMPYADTVAYQNMPTTNHASSVPMSPGSTGSGSTTEHLRPSTRPYVFPDSASFNKKIIKSHHHPQQNQQKSRESTSQRHHLSMDLLKQELESERAVVYALQRQKEAYNKDITYLCQNVDTLAKEEKEWKAKYQQEKVEKKRYQDDLSAAMEKFNEAMEQIKQLTNDKERLNLELENANHRLDLERRKRSAPASISANPISSLQQPHQGQQLKLIQTTMQQLLQLNLFDSTESMKERKRDQNENSHAKTMTRANSIFSSISGQQQQQQERKSSTTTPRPRSSSSNQNSTTTTTIVDNNSNSSDPTSSKDAVPRNTPSSTDLDNQLLQRLLQEKELLQAEYSKIPVSGRNAIYRRRREDLEAKLDEVDSKMRKIRLKIRCRHRRN